MTEKAISPLRRRLIEDMAIRRLRTITAVRRGNRAIGPLGNLIRRTGPSGRRTGMAVLFTAVRRGCASARSQGGAAPPGSATEARSRRRVR